MAAISNQGRDALKSKAQAQKSTGVEGKFGHLQAGESAVALDAELSYEEFREMAKNTDTALQELMWRRFKLSSNKEDYEKSARRYAGASRHREHLEELAAEAGVKIAELDTKIKPLDDLYAEHQWTRFIAVPGGHMHSEYGCHTLRWNTDTRLMAEFSGAEEEDLIEMAGDFCCTHCFKDAPVNQPSMLPMHVKERADQEKAAAEKETKRLEKVKKSADPTHPEGLFTASVDGRRERFKTITAMVNESRRQLENMMIYNFDGWRTPEQQEVERHKTLADIWPVLAQAAQRNQENGAKLTTPEELLRDLWDKKAKQRLKDGYPVPEGYDPFNELPGA